MDIEEWRTIPDYEGLEASNLGRIRSYRWTLNRFHKEMADEPRIKALRLNEKGYLDVGIGHSKTRKAHVLIAAAFLGPSNGLDVNHIDGDKTNNHVENLEYVTRSENLKHAFRLGLATTPFGKRGERSMRAVLTDGKVIEMRERYSNGASRRQLATDFGVSYYTVWDITERRSWTHI